MPAVPLQYGEGTIRLEVPEGSCILEPRFAPGLADERAAVLEALRQPIGCPPLGEILKPGDEVCVVVPDKTRPAPTSRLVSWLKEATAGIPGVRLFFLVGTGSHRPSPPRELEALLGPDTLGAEHDARDGASLELVGHTPSGLAVWLNRRYVRADRRITISLLEPHFFAGFSGGPKAVVPGIAGLDTILDVHSARLIGHPASTWGRLEDNPVQKAIAEACALLPPDLSINVAINRQREIVGVFAGDVRLAHRQGCAFVSELAHCPVDHPFPIVVTTNGGWPLDQNLYQTVKGLSAAARILAPGGCIVAASECRLGLPAGGFASILRSAATPRELLAKILGKPDTREDEWQALVLCSILDRATIFLYSSLGASDVHAAFLHPVASVEEGLERARQHLAAAGRPTPGQEQRARVLPLGLSSEARLAKAWTKQDRSVAVLPEGPFTLPYVRS
jgi:nickel-dependent lactate racemase